MTLNWQAGKGLASSPLRRQALLYLGRSNWAASSSYGPASGSSAGQGAGGPGGSQVNHPAQAGARLKGTRTGPRTGRKDAPLDSVELAK